MILEGENQEIELIVQGYEFPKINDNFWDNNWLMIYCRKTINGKTVSGSFPCCLTTELESLQKLLEQFRNGRIASVEWGGTEPNFEIYLNKDNLLEIFFYHENGIESFDEAVKFRKTASNNDIESLIGFCRDGLKKYPIRACT